MVRRCPKRSQAHPPFSQTYHYDDLFENVPCPRLSHIGIVAIRGMLLADVHDSLRPSVMLNVAFMAGSSKQGNDRRASTASNWLTARYLVGVGQHPHMNSHVGPVGCF